MAYNCMTHALRIEDLTSYPGDLDVILSPKDAISAKCAEWHRNSRIITPDSSIDDDEWRVVFFGYIPVEDYEGEVDHWDYHFVRQEHSGKWSERASIGKPIQEIEIQSFLKAFKEAFTYGKKVKPRNWRKFEVLWFAVKIVSD